MAIKKISANLLGNNAVTAASIAGGAISAADIADNSITAAKLSASTSPTFGGLTVNNNVTVNTDTNSTFTIADGGADAITLYGGTGDELYIGANNAYSLRFKTTGDIVMDNGGSLGIGTSSPDEKLEIEGGTTAEFYAFNTVASLTPSDSVFISAPRASNLGFFTQSTERLTIDGLGNVGIGATSLLSPGGTDATTFTVKATAYPQIFMIASNAAANSTTYRQIVRHTREYQIQAMNDAGSSEQTAYEINRASGSNSIDSQKWFAGTSEAMRLDSSGNVAIGTSNVVSRLSIGNPSADGVIDYTKGITFIDTVLSTSDAFVHAAIVTTGSTGYNGNLIFATDGNGSQNNNTSGLTERMRITSDGKIGINENIPSGKLHVYDPNFTGYMLNLTNGGTGGGNHGFIMECASTSSYLGIWKTQGTTRFYVDGSGNYYFSGSNQSDINKKENIADITDSALDLITQLQPKTYNFIGSDIDKAGFIAQDMEQVIPRLVTGNEFDSTLTDEDGNNPTGKGIDYMGYTAYLTKAIQEQQTIIDDLKSRLDSAGL